MPEARLLTPNQVLSVEAFEHAADIRWLFTDVDDTLTWNGRLPPETLIALQKLQDAGIKVVAVTGGCAGWCDQIAKLWPVEAVLGENGAFCMSASENGFETEYFRPRHQMQREQAIIKAQVLKLLKRYPGVEFAEDQAFRFCDVAINIGQNRESLAERTIQSILAEIKTLVVNGEPVKATVSSIHINIWKGEHSKKFSSEAFLRARGVGAEEIAHSVGFVGDSPNDESMFCWLEHTFGVANIVPKLEQMEYRPAFLLTKPGGYGFKQLAEFLLNQR